MEDICQIIDAQNPPEKRGPYKKVTA